MRNEICPQDSCKLTELQYAIEDARAENARLTAELERAITQFAGVSTAAMGWITDPAKDGDYGWSVPYQDTLELRRKYEVVLTELERARKALRHEIYRDHEHTDACDACSNNDSVLARLAPPTEGTT